jgi:hypothetical protein
MMETIQSDSGTDAAIPNAFYKYMSCATAEAILRSQCLRWSSPLRFNDAFDVPRVLDFGYSTVELQEAVYDEMARLFASGANDPPFATPTVLATLAALRAKVAAGHLTFEAMAASVRAEANAGRMIAVDSMRVIQEEWKKIIPKFRILCMTTAPDSPQMWAYYADELRGVALEFVPSSAYASPFVQMKRVRYSGEQPRLFTKEKFAREMLGYSQAAFREHFEELQRTKDTLWGHEKEWRAIGLAKPDDTEDFNDFPFHPLELRRIIYGPHVRDSARRPIEALRKQPEWQHVSAANIGIDHRMRAFVLHPDVSTT